MKRQFALLILLATTVVPPASAQTAHDTESQKARVVEVVTACVAGTLSANPDRVASCLHPRVNQVQVRRISADGGAFLGFRTFSGLLEVARSLSDRADQLEKEVNVEILTLGHGMAAATAVSRYRHELFQLAEIDGDWKVLNVLTAGTPPRSGEDSIPEEEAEEAVIRKTALDYIEGSFTGDADRMARAIHPEINKVFPAPGRNGTVFLHLMGASDLIEGTRAGLGTVEEDERDIVVEIQDVFGDVAAVTIHSSAYIDHLQTAKIDGEWRIVNVLWIPRPE